MTNSQADNAQLQAELDALRQRVADLEAALTTALQRERTLYTNHQRLEQILATTPLAGIEWDREGSIQSWNASAERIFGWRADEVLGKNLFALLVPDIAREHVQHVVDTLLSGEFMNSRNLNITRDGRLITCQWHNTILRNVDGEVIGAFSQAEDVSAAVEQEQRLRMFEALVQNTPDGFMVATHTPGVHERRITYGNPALLAMFGYDAPDEITIPAIHSDGQAVKLEQVNQHVAQHDSWRGTLNYVRRDGSTFTGQASIFLVRDSSGQVQARAVIIRDITAQVEQEERLRVFEALVENAPDGFIVASTESSVQQRHVLYANPALLAMTGYHAEDHMTVPQLFGADSNNIVRVNEQVNAQGYWKGDLLLACRDGSTMPTQTSVFVLRDTEGYIRARAAIIRDVTERVQQQQEREALQQQMIEVQQAAIRELSTPLIPLADHVVAMPIVGTVDSARAQQILETLLEGIAAYQSEMAILDITGVQTIDTQVADALVHTAQAVRLLGAQVILTGISPAIAQTLVHLGVDLAGIITHSRFQDGIRIALRNGHGG